MKSSKQTEMTLGGKKVGRQPRAARRPQHRFFQEAKYWEINPVVIAPVLPGETLRNALLQVRAVSSPIKSSVVGSWYEFYLFYVTHRQLMAVSGTDDYINMVLDNTDVMATSAADNARTFYDGRGHNWLLYSLQLIVQEWFRRSDEAVAIATGRNSRYLASIGIDSFLDSFHMIASQPGGTGGALGATQVDQERAYNAWEYQRLMGWTKATYEDWVSTYGVQYGVLQERDRPELLRYIREWTYPTNVVDPTSGVPSAALSWGVVERADKRRFFKEPGFLVGIQLFRPKIYLTNQTGYASTMLDRASRWLPAIMAEAPADSISQFTTTQGPLGKAAAGLASDYLLDVRDLFLYGDQYMDVISGSTQLNGIALPTTAGVHRYASETISDGLFTGATDATRVIRSDGNLSFNILGTQQDMT